MHNLGNKITEIRDCLIIRQITKQLDIIFQIKIMNFTKYNNKRNTIKIETVSNYKKKERLNQKIRQII